MSELINFNEEISNSLPWYEIPLGVLDDGTPFIYPIASHTIKSSMREEEKYYTNPSSHCGIFGYSGSGKSIMCNTVIKHLHKKDVMVKYFTVEGYNNQKIDNVEIFNVKDLNYQLSILENIMYRRIEALKKNDSPGFYLDLQDGIVVNDMYIDDILPLKNKDVSVKDLKEEQEEDYEDLEFVSYKDGHYERHEKIELDRTKFNGTYCMKPIVYIIDEIVTLDEDKEKCSKKIENIVRLGRSVEIHIVLASQNPDGIASPDIRNNINHRIICGKVPEVYSRKVLETDDAENLDRYEAYSNSMGEITRFHPYYSELIFRFRKNNRKKPEDLKYDYLSYLFE